MSYDPLYARAVNGFVYGAGNPYHANCPGDAVPIDVQTSSNRAVGLVLVCPAPDN